MAGLFAYTCMLMNRYHRELSTQPAPTLGRDNEAAKDELAAQMQYRGMNAQQRMAARVEHEHRAGGVMGQQGRRAGEEGVAHASRSKERQTSISADDMCDDIQREIDERWQFLAEMQAAGKGDQYRAQIRSEIAQRVTQLKRLDALITERDYHLLHDDSDGGGGGRGGGGTRYGGPRGGAPVAVGGMMQKARGRMGAAKIG